MLAKALIVCGLCALAATGVKSEDDLRELAPRVALGDIARQLINKSTSNSQVLSLNLTNLIILLILKGLLFGAAYVGAGHHKGRALETQELLSESEVMLVASYLMGDADKDYGCLYRIACQDPEKSGDYVTAAKVLLKAGKMFDVVDPKYEELVTEMQDAADFGVKYGTCDQRYTCDARNYVRRRR